MKNVFFSFVCLKKVERIYKYIFVLVFFGWFKRFSPVNMGKQKHQNVFVDVSSSSMHAYIKPPDVSLSGIMPTVKVFLRKTSPVDS